MRMRYQGGNRDRERKGQNQGFKGRVKNVASPIGGSGGGKLGEDMSRSEPSRTL